MTITNEARILIVTGAFAVGTVITFIFGYTAATNFLTVLGISVGMGVLLAAIALGCSLIAGYHEDGGWDVLYGFVILSGLFFAIYLCWVAPWAAIGWVVFLVVRTLVVLSVIMLLLYLFCVGLSDQATRTSSTTYTQDYWRDSSDRMPPDVWIPLAKSIRRRDNWTCTKCGINGFSLKLDVHHILPLSQGGTNREDNLTTLCRECHEKHHGYSFDDVD